MKQKMKKNGGKRKPLKHVKLYVWTKRKKNLSILNNHWSETWRKREKSKGNNTLKIIGFDTFIQQPCSRIITTKIKNRKKKWVGEMREKLEMNELRWNEKLEPCNEEKKSFFSYVWKKKGRVFGVRNYIWFLVGKIKV